MKLSFLFFFGLETIFFQQQAHALSNVYSAPLTLRITAYDEECFLLRVPPANPRYKYSLTASYELVDDETALTAEPVMIALTEYHTEKLRAKRWGRPRGVIHEKLEGGTKWWLCVQNSLYHADKHEEEPEHPDQKDRVVGLHYNLRTYRNYDYEEPDKEQSEHDKWLVRSALLWKEKSDEVLESVRRLVHHHSYMKSREAKHRSVTEGTFTSILKWFLAEATLVLFVAVGQIMYFRRFLEKKNQNQYGYQNYYN